MRTAYAINRQPTYFLSYLQWIAHFCSLPGLLSVPHSSQTHPLCFIPAPSPDSSTVCCNLFEFSLSLLLHNLALSIRLYCSYKLLGMNDTTLFI